jgi:hypothetical protein
LRRKLKVSDEKSMKVSAPLRYDMKVPQKSQDTYWQDVGSSKEAQIDYVGARTS